MHASSRCNCGSLCFRKAAELGLSEADVERVLTECKLALTSLDRLQRSKESDWTARLYEPLVEKLASLGRICDRCIVHDCWWGNFLLCIE